MNFLAGGQFSDDRVQKSAEIFSLFLLGGLRVYLPAGDL
jgi:hypothetical protein